MDARAKIIDAVTMGFRDFWARPRSPGRSLLSPLCGAVLIAALILSTGCQRYVYQIVEPSAGAGRVGKETRNIPLAPLEYRFLSDEDRLVMQVVNPQSAPINLVGNKSYLVNPAGETQPLESRTIGPRSYITLVLPPAPNIVYTPPPLSFGFGSIIPYGPYHRYYGPGFFYEPIFYPPSGSFQYSYPAHYWEWKQGDVRMHLGYELTNNVLEHDFLFRRQKAD